MFVEGRLKGRSLTMYMGNIKIEYVSKYKYLGVIFDDRLTFRSRPHLVMVRKKLWTLFIRFVE